MPSLKEKFGLRLQKIRKSKGLTQEKLAEKIGVDTPHISNIERGKYFVTAETLENIATALEIDVRDLFDFGHIREREEIASEIKTYLNECNISQLEFLAKIVSSLQELGIRD